MIVQSFLKKAGYEIITEGEMGFDFVVSGAENNGRGSADVIAFIDVGSGKEGTGDEWDEKVSKLQHETGMACWLEEYGELIGECQLRFDRIDVTVLNEHRLYLRHIKGMFSC